MRVPLYKEAEPHKPFLCKVKHWLKSRKLKPETLLISRSNLIIAVLHGPNGQYIICFYVQKLCALGTGGMIVYFDPHAPGTAIKQNIEQTFTNWVAQRIFQ